MIYTINYVYVEVSKVLIFTNLTFLIAYTIEEYSLSLISL